jgi:hypothetical protein
MPETDSDNLVRIYEGASLTVKGEVAANHADLVEDVTFKFFIDGKQSEEKTIPISEGKKDSSDAVVVTYALRAADVPADKDSYILDYHVFYKVKHKDKSGEPEPRENLAIKKFEVVPRTAQLKVLSAKDGKPVPNFQFKVFQGGEQVGGFQSTFAQDTKNAKGETVPAGTAEFNLELKPGFSIVQASPCEITEQTVVTGRKRELKGELKFRAVFVTPKKGSIKQYVNLPSENNGITGKGCEVTIAVAVEGDDDRVTKIGNEKTAVHFRATFGPDDGEAVAKSTRDDADHPTKVLKVKTDDTTATIEEKTAKKKYQGKVTLGGGVGYFKVALGVAGGDTCTVEIAGSDKFLTDESVPADQTLRFQNWRRVYYELMVPDIMASRALASQNGATPNLAAGALRRLENLGRQLFIDFEHTCTQVFDAMECAGQGTLLRKNFLGSPAAEDDIAYVLSGRNWRELPDSQSWLEQYPGKTLYIAPCDALLKWRKDTKEPKAGTKDYSGTLTQQNGSLDMEKTFSGLFMPFSGDDGGDGITDIAWTADISKDDSCCKYTPKLEIEEIREATASAEELTVYIGAEDGFGADPLAVPFRSKDDKFEANLDESETGRLQGFVDNLLFDRALLASREAKVKVQVNGPKDAGRGEDACFNAVKNKLTELFGSTKKEFAFHPGLDEEGNPRIGTCALADISDGLKSTMHTWHYSLAEFLGDMPGPGSFVGATKNAEKCPVKIEFSVQPHKATLGTADGKLIAWVCTPPKGDANLVRLVLQAFATIKDEKGIAHGHSDGKPGDCLDKSDTLCADCVSFGRSRNLDLIP